MVTQHVRRALLIGAALLCPISVLAQADSPELSAVLDCADIEREILRLECYDEAVAALRRGARADASERGGPASEQDEPAAARPESADERRGEAETEADDDDSRAPAPRVVAERDLPAAAGSGSDDAAEGDRQVTIVEVRTPVPGRAVFVTAEGAEFVQTSGRLRLFLPDVPFQATLRSGAVGGMFLTPEGTRRSIRITRRD